MKTKAVRLYGENDLRLEEFELPELKNGEILIKIISDSVCMSTYKTVKQGAKHLRVPDNVAEKPVIIGHEFCAEVVEVTDKWKDQFHVGDKVAMPPVLSYLGGMQTVGYSFGEIGGVSTYSIVYEHIIENGYLMKLDSDCFFKGSLIEPASCVLRGYKGSMHLDTDGVPYTNLRSGGKVAILAGCGPMGLVAIDLAIHGTVKPSVVVVTDLDENRLARAEEIFCPEKAAQDGINLIFSNSTHADELIALAGGEFDDVFVYAPVPAVVELGDEILGFDGCLNFFAGPLDQRFSAKFNFYNVHYKQHHVSGTSGSTIEDMQDIVRLISQQKIDPAVMITHIGGIDAAIDTTIHLPQIPGGKKLIYTHINLPLTAIADFAALGETDDRFKALDTLVKEGNGLWNARAEKYFLENFGG
ncbi:MAG: L-sorbose 1-phosphate reductase [Ruminococcaceae bacterium]|nr:L-sorbose 1-phosphate reductase [Oscillospiraceae bacterium]